MVHDFAYFTCFNSIWRTLLPFLALVLIQCVSFALSQTVFLPCRVGVFIFTAARILLGILFEWEDNSLRRVNIYSAAAHALKETYFVMRKTRLRIKSMRRSTHVWKCEQQIPITFIMQSIKDIKFAIANWK